MKLRISNKKIDRLDTEMESQNKKIAKAQNVFNLFEQVLSGAIRVIRAIRYNYDLLFVNTGPAASGI